MIIVLLSGFYLENLVLGGKLRYYRRQHNPKGTCQGLCSLRTVVHERMPSMHINTCTNAHLCLQSYHFNVTGISEKL